MKLAVFHWLKNTVTDWDSTNISTHTHTYTLKRIPFTYTEIKRASEQERRRYGVKITTPVRMPICAVRFWCIKSIKYICTIYVYVCECECECEFVCIYLCRWTSERESARERKGENNSEKKTKQNEIIHWIIFCCCCCWFW